MARHPADPDDLTTTGIAVIVAGPDGTIRSWNTGAELLCGWTAAEVVSRNILDILPEEPASGNLNGIMDLLRSDEPCSAEILVRHKNASIFRAHVTNSPLIDPEGCRTSIIVLSTESWRPDQIEQRSQPLADITDHNAALDALRYSEEQLRSAFYDAAIAMGIADLDGWIVQVNQPYCDLMGYPEDEIGRMNIDDLIHPEDRERAYQARTALLRGEASTIQAERRFLRGDGEIAWGFLNLSLMRGEDHGPVAFLTQIQNITDHKRAEIELTRLKDRYQLLLDNANDVIVALDTSGQVTFVNQMFCALSGYDEAEALTLNIADVIHPDDWPVVQENIKKRMAGESIPGNYEFRAVTRDGQTIDIEINASVIFEGERPVGIQAIVRDIRDRKAAEAAMKASDERFRALVQHSSEIITIVDAHGIIHYQSPAFERILGYAPDERTGHHFGEHIHPDDVPQVTRAFQTLLACPDNPITIELQALHRDGSYRTLEAIATNLLDHPTVQGIVINTRDISERRRAERRLAENEQRYRSLFDHNPDAVYSLNMDGEFVNLNRASEVLTGRSKSDLLGMPFLPLIVPEDRERIWDAFQKIVAGQPLSLETALTAAGGNRVDLVITAMPIIIDDEVCGVFGISKDITQQKQLEAQLVHEALHDPLTGLPNRTLFLERLTHALSMSDRRGVSVAVLFLDLDNFKVINDSLGHATGDQLLVAVAERLNSCIRLGDTIARFGGDEFAILLEDVTAEDVAVLAAQRISDALEIPFTLGRHQLFITTSIGIAISNDEQRDPQDLLRFADVALYRAKHAGKAQHAIFAPTMNDDAMRRLQLEHALRTATENQELIANYQPIVDLTTGQIVEIETLLRWQHPEEGIICPAEFLPIAEEIGLVTAIGQQLIQDVCRQLQEWRQAIPGAEGLSISVNLSTRQFQDERLIETIAELVQTTGIDPGNLKLEITESMLMADPERTIKALQQLKSIGVRFAIDDFGTGYSSLAYLKRFPVDSLKIDHSFIRGITENPEDRGLVAAMIAAAKVLGLSVTAEGIETAQEAETLRALGCDRGQGYYFAHPMSADEMTELLRRPFSLNVPSIPAS